MLGKAGALRLLLAGGEGRCATTEDQAPRLGGDVEHGWGSRAVCAESAPKLEFRPVPRINREALLEVTITFLLHVREGAGKTNSCPPLNVLSLPTFPLLHPLPMAF